MDIKDLRWGLILGLAAFALIRPLLSVTGVMDQLPRPLTPILVTLGISAVWIAVVGFGRVAQPVLTLVFAGLAYGVFVIALSAILSPILTGQLRGPLAVPYAILPVLALNALWGAVAGVLALAVQRLLGRPSPAPERP